MSGIVGMVHFDGAPVNARLLRALTDTMKCRGPDALQTWCDGSVGFGHVMLRTTWESENETQPFSLDGEVWIVADLRIDDHATLEGKLRGRTRGNVEQASDAELVLHAYAVWGEDCVQYLLGDFAFAIWDGPQRKLFCARDHLGIKPFFYTRLGGTLVFSNTLNTLRAYPGVSERRNDLAICDFLLFGCNQDPATTSFADIQRLSHSHTLVCDGGRLSIRRYWQVPAPELLRYRRSSEYVEQFWHLLTLATEDRLRTAKAGVLMSGGLDSPTIAASALDASRRRGRSLHLKAFTVVYDSLIRDDERYYSGIAAKALGVPIEYLAADRYFDPETWGNPGLCGPEPAEISNLRLASDLHALAAGHARVLFYGEGPDNLLHFEYQPYVQFLYARREYARLALDVLSFIVRCRRIPFANRLGALVLRKNDKVFSATKCARGVLECLESDLVKRYGLPDRVMEFTGTRQGNHALRPTAQGSMDLALWRHIFDGFDPGTSQHCVEVRHPYLDLRMINYLLAVPPIPWAANKLLIRESIRGHLPESIRCRRKTSLAKDPRIAIRGLARWFATRMPHGPAVRRYVRASQDRVCRTQEDLILFERVLSLNHWLNSQGER